MHKEAVEATDHPTQNAIGLNFEFCESTVPPIEGVSNAAARSPAAAPCLFVPFVGLWCTHLRSAWGPPLGFT
jgi:hypothetical protein